MKQIALTQNKFTLVDDDVYEWAKNYKWYANARKNTFYVVRHFNKDDGTRGFMELHQCVAGYPLYKKEIDHIDGNGLNNQRSNLRIVTRRVNQQNHKEHREGKLVGAYFGKKKYKGKIYTGYRSQIRINGKIKYLGHFKTELEAHMAYVKELYEEAEKTDK